MNQTETFPGDPTSRMAFIFTNAAGNVIFADRGYRQLTGDSSSRTISGDLLKNILLINTESVDRLLTTTRKTRQLQNLDIPIRSADGKTIRTNGTSIATINETNNFLGIDLVLRTSPAVPSDDATKIQNHADVLKILVENIMNEGSKQYSRTYLQSYLVAQIESIQILLSRINGLAARNA